jgi:hypothetical protein
VSVVPGAAPRLRTRHPPAFGAFTALVLISTRVSGQGSVDQCVDANTRAQALRHDGKLGEAREQLKHCADTSCPGLVRDDCTQLLDDLDRAQPTIVFDVKDTEGQDLTKVQVDIDGHPFADRLDGVALAADPGAHTFTFRATGKPPFVQQVVIREGEKNRRENIVLKGPESRDAGEIPASRPLRRVSPVGAPSEGMGAQRTGAVIVGAAGVGALALAGALALVARSKSDDADALCPATICPSPQALRMNREALQWGDAATVAVVSGAAAVGAAAALWFSARSSSGHASIDVAVSGTAFAVRGTW